jgi:hypothetical protein
MHKAGMLEQFGRNDCGFHWIHLMRRSSPRDVSGKPSPAARKVRILTRIYKAILFRLNGA